MVRGAPVDICDPRFHVYVCTSVCHLLTESFCSIQGLRSCISNKEALDGHSTVLHQLLALVLL